MKNTLIKTVHDIGLSEKEARVYVTLLGTGPAAVSTIARAAELKRTTVYSLLESLKQKGLAITEVRGFKRRFVAESPEKLQSIVELKREKMNVHLPELLALFNLKGGESLLRYYEGLPAVKSVYEQLLKDVKIHEDYMVITDQQQWLKLDPEFFLDFTKRRAKLNIRIRMLMQDSPMAREHKILEKNFNEKIKFLPKGTSLTTNLVVIPRRVVIHQLTPPILAIVVENPSVVRLHRELFEIIWNSLPE